jgi:hypothetical protein
VQGTFEEAIGERVLEAAMHLEEHFDSGLTHWTGGTGDWRVDVAGVRVGSLALLYPTLATRDYEFQFLTKLGNSGIGFAFRASDLENYYAVKLNVPAGDTAAPGELIRYGVFQGHAETPIVVPLPEVIRSKAALTVRVSVSGDHFTTSIDGQVVDEWADARLGEGGIGFFSDKQHPARLYWVRLSPC